MNAHDKGDSHSNDGAVPVRAGIEILSEQTSIGQRVILKGWIRSLRTSRAGIAFLHISDGSCLQPVQAIVDENVPNYSEILTLSTGTAVSISGEVVESLGKGQDREILADKVDIVGTIEHPESYPVAKKKHSFEYLRTVAHLRPRTNTFGAIARLRHNLAMAVHEFFSERGFVWVNTPIITGSDCEGAGDLFRVSALDLANFPGYDQDFFGRETFLSVSGQLNVEAFCLALSKVYTFGPTFRAENSNTARHLAEFWMIEPEIAFADLNDNADLAEDFLKSVFTKVVENSADDLNFFQQRIDGQIMSRIDGVTNNLFIRMDYTEAIRELKNSKQSFEFPVEWGNDLQSEHEKYLTKIYNSPVIVMNYPESIKAFYMRLNDDQKTVAAMDVLVPGVGEIIGGSQREERFAVLDSRMDETVKEELWWYLALRQYGSVPHAGFGVGFERLLMYLTGMQNIRDVIPFPRTPSNASF